MRQRLTGCGPARSMDRRAVTGVAVVVAVALALGGCTGGGGDDPPSPDFWSTAVPVLPPSAPASPRVTPTPSAPAKPVAADVRPKRSPAMKREDEKGAVAAAKYFLELFRYVYATGDLKEWVRMSHPKCAYCFRTVDDALSVKQEGKHQDGGEVTWLRAPRYSWHSVDGVHEVGLVVRQGASRFFDSRGKVTGRSNGSVSDVQVFLVFGKGAWRVRAVNGATRK